MWHTRSARAFALALGALVAVVGLTTTGWTGPDDQRRGPNVSPDGSSSPEPPRQAAWVEASIQASSTFSCPTGQRAFSNPAMHYRLCYPDGWGFSDFRQSDRLEQIPVRSLQALRLLSGNSFPWAVGDRPFDAVVTRNLVDVELNLLQPGATPTPGECEPSTVRHSGSLTILSCSQTYDLTGQPVEVGPIAAIRYVVPLLRPPVSADTSLDLTGSSLLVIVRARTARVAGEVDLGWDLVRSIAPF